MSFTAGDVKQLREMTGAGMMACKEALTATNGNVDEAVDYLRKKGLAAAAKKQSRIAAEGVISTIVEGNFATVVEVNCETDFVAKGDDFKGFADAVAHAIIKNKPSDIEALKTVKLANGTVTEGANELTMKCGEKVDVRRFETIALNGAGLIGSYNHGGRIGVLVAVQSDKATDAKVQELAKDIAMHVAAAAPKFLDGSQIDDNFKKKEAEIYAAQLKEEGKPENMIDKIVMGKLNKLAKEVCLLEQAYVKNPDVTVAQHVANIAKEIGATIKVDAFKKLNLGEGIEKKQDNLAEEVAKLTGGSH